MANNNSITYCNSIKNSYSDSLPNPDVVTGAIFNDMNRGLMELKWRNSIQRTWKNSEIFTAYGSTVPSGSVLMHECVDITFNDMASASDQRRHIVRFHLQKGRDEQIVTYRSNYDSVSGVSVIHIDWGSDLFPITVQTGSQVGGANNKLKIEFQATSNNADEFSYWIETNAPCTTIFDGKNTARNSSSNSSWNNLSYILDNDLGHRQGTFSDVYKNDTFGYQREYYNLGSTTWKLQTGANSYTNARIYGDSSYGSVLDVSRVITNLATVNTVNANASSKYFAFTAKTGKDVTFNATAEKGNYVYKISYKKDNKEVAARTVSVSVKKAADNAVVSAYRLDIDNKNVDMKVDNDNKEKTINIQMIGVADGVDKEVEADATFTVKKADGTKIFVGNKTAETTTHAAISASTGTLVVKPVVISGSALAVKQLDAGEYTVIAEKNITENGTTKTVTISTTFTITDTQAKAEVEVKNNTVAAGTVGDMLEKALIVTFDGKTYTSISDITDKDGSLTIGEVKVKKNTDGKEVSGTSTSVSAGQYFTVTKLTVKVNVATGIDTYVTVTVPGTITAK